MSQTRLKLPAGRTVLIAALAALSVSCCFYTALNAPMGGDYPGPACKGCDVAGPPIEALASGRIHQFFATQPFMGSVTLLLRAPAVAIARSVGAGELAQYRLGCLICLLVSAGLAWVVVAKMRPNGKQWIFVVLLLGLLLSSPLTAKALAWGHPEELVGALLCVVAVVLANRGQVTLAGVSLGLAIATKQWAALAIPLVIVACPRQRVRLVVIAAGVAGVFILPMLIGDPSRFLAQNLQAGMPSVNTDTFGVTATNIWFPYAKLGGVVVNGSSSAMVYRLPAALATIAHPLVLLLGVALPVVYWLRTRGRSADDILLLLALVFLLRCVLDPVTLSYHHLPFFVVIACYETLGRRRLPIISIYTAAAIWALAAYVAPSYDASTLNRVYLAWVLPLTAYLAYRVFGPRAQGAVARRVRGAAQVAAETT